MHIYRCENPKRAHRLCPYHKKKEYGELQEFYDTTRMFFDCGTFIDYGYSYYEPPKLYRNITIFKDEAGYTAWALGGEILAKMVSLKQARRIANAHLAKNGTIIEKVKE